MPQLMRLLLATVATAIAVVAPASAASTGFRPGLLSGVRLAPTPVPVDAQGFPVGASLSFRLSATASVRITVFDTRWRLVGTAYRPATLGPCGGARLLPAGAATLAIAPNSDDIENFQFEPGSQGILRPRRQYLMIVDAGYEQCEAGQPKASYIGLPVLRWFSTVAAPPTA